jgi:hypothetical protein
MSFPVRVRRECWLTLLATLVLPLVLQAQGAASNAGPDPQRLAMARQVIQASGAEALMVSTIEQSLPTQRAQNPSIPSEFWDRVAAKARADIGGLVDSLAPVYAKRFSKAELEQILGFYKSPVGQHVLAEQGPIATESQQLGIRWGTRLGAAVAVEMANEGKSLGR